MQQISKKILNYSRVGWASSHPYWNLFFPETGYLQPFFTGKSKEEKAAIPTSVPELCFPLFVPPTITPYSLPMVEESLDLFKPDSTIFERNEGQ